MKEHSAGKVPRMRANLHTITPEIFRVLGGVYVKCVDTWAPANAPPMELPAISLLCLKILRRLMVSGYEFPNRSETVGQFWQILQQHLASFLGLTNGSGEYVNIVRKHVIHLGKIFLDVSRSHQCSFVLLPGTLELVKFYWGLVVSHGESLASSKPIGGQGHKRQVEGNGDSDDGTEEFREKVALHGMLLFRACVKVVYSPNATYRCAYSLQVFTVTCINI